MRKVILIALTIVSTHTFGQSFIERFHFGLKAGANYSNFINTDFDTEGLMGFHTGAIIAFEIFDKWFIQEDFLFSTQGAKIKNNLFDEDIEISYLNVPIVVKYHSNLGLYVEAGLQFNMLLKDYDGFGDEDFADKIDFGVVGGIGYQFKNNLLDGLGIGVRYYLGISKAGNFDASNIETDFKNGVAQMSLFYII